MKTKIYLVALLLCLIGKINTSYAQCSTIVQFTGFDGAFIGGTPQVDQNLLAIGDFFYGMTSGGGSTGLGVIFKVKPDGTGYTVLTEFDGKLKGRSPNGSLYFDGTFLYGTTTIGGMNETGTIFKIKPDGSGFTKLYDFPMYKGTSKCTLISDGTFLYGVAGNIFKIKPDGTEFSEITVGPAGTWSEVNNVVGSLIYDGTFLYAMGYDRLKAEGLIFKIKPDGSGFINLMYFDKYTSLGYPVGSLISDGIYLYGMTEGSTVNYGTIFKIKTDGTDYTNLKKFDGLGNGRNPKGSLLLSGTDLYGMTRDGGARNYGALFKITTDGTFSTLPDFCGNFPTGSLISDGQFLYGMSQGGPLGQMRGIIFKYELTTTGINDTHAENDFSVYPNPASSQLTIKVKEQSQITIVNILGEVVKTEAVIGASTIDVSNWTAGVYIVKISDGRTTKQSSVIIQK
jgi:uncharacterized repeat protein (TIGR03803 family)